MLAPRSRLRTPRGARSDPGALWGLNLPHILAPLCTTNCLPFMHILLGIRPVFPPISGYLLLLVSAHSHAAGNSRRH
jgi:hypothetical protein